MELWEACSRSFVFFCNGFVWTLDPRSSTDRKMPSAIPFVLYPCQRTAALDIIECIETGQDLAIVKSRDMGASWVIQTVFMWMFLFRPDQTFLIASRTKDYVDMSGNPKALMQRLDFAFERLPTWLLPRRGKGIDRVFMAFTNLENGSKINGESTTGNLGRGDRRTALMIDEFAAYEVQDGFDALASTRDVTRCRIFNSTISPHRGAFDSLLDNPDIRKIEMHWSAHPDKAKGIRRTEAGTLTSPWYERERRRCSTAQEIACELDMDRGAASNAFFASEDINISATHVRNPWKVGEMEIDDRGSLVRWEDGISGRCSLWMIPDATNEFPKDRRFILGADVSAGTGASNSVLTVFDAMTGEQVFEYVNPNIRPDRLARVAAAAGRWFAGVDGRGALVVFENQGPGTAFLSAMWDLGYRNFYARKIVESLNPRTTTDIGVFLNRDEQVRQWNLFRQMLTNGQMVIRSRLAIEDCRGVSYDKSGGIQHAGAKNLDPSGAKANHGDRASACCLAAVGLAHSGGVHSVRSKEERTLGEFGKRLLEGQRALRASASDGW